MDCRKPLALVVCLAFLPGCVPGKLTWFSRPAVPAALDAEASASAKDPSKAVKPQTLVAFASFKEKQADEPGTPPDQQQHMREHARLAYLRALTLDPNCAAAHLGLARLFDKADNHEQALARFAQALKLASRDPDLWHEVGMYHARHKEWGSALEHLKRASELDPENRQIVKSYALGLARNGRLEESLAQFRKVMPEAEAHYTVARMLKHVNQVEQSKEQVQLALRANPAYEPAHRLLAELEGRFMPPQFLPTNHTELEN